jgi:hypothetical protein
MKDKLEKFIAENRDQFDVFDPDDKLWKGISSRIRKPVRRRISTRGILWRAAAVVIIFMLSFAVQEFLIRKDIRITKRDKAIRTDAIPELKEAEIYYTNLVNEKLSQIQPMIEEFPELGEELHSDLTDLDSIYESLKADLVDNIANDEVVEAMIQNYRLKLRILEDIQSFLQETSKTKDNEENEHDI